MIGGFLIGVGFGIVLTWMFKVEFSLGVILLVGGLFAVLPLVYLPWTLLPSSLVQITERGLRRMPVSGNPIEYRFDELESFSLHGATGEGQAARFWMLVIKKRSSGEIRILVPSKVTHEEIRNVLAGDLPECMPA